MILLLRVDHRLLHGQVAFSWTQTLGADCILIANDAVAGDELRKTTMKLAKPQGVKLVIKDIKAAIEALPPVIPSIRKIFVGQNINADEKWDICLESEFDTLEDVKAYAVHPAHVAAAGILKEAKQDRACTDYIF